MAHIASGHMGSDVAMRVLTNAAAEVDYHG